MSIAAEFARGMAAVNHQRTELESKALSTCTTIANQINLSTSEVRALPRRGAN